MAETASRPSDGTREATPRLVGSHSGDFGPSGPPEWPRFHSLEDAETSFPRLHLPGARPVTRDRWERLVTIHELPAPPARVWQALTEPDSLRNWLAVCRGSLLDPERDCMLDFEDGEFFLCRTQVAQPGAKLHYLWRWLGIGQATSVTWELAPVVQGTRVTVTEEALNPPWDWQTWNGGGWPGILEQLAAYLRTGTEWRWPWRRMGPYAQIELPVSMYEAWDLLFSPSALKYWLIVMNGSLESDAVLSILMGDASGMVEMGVQEVVQPGQHPPSFLPHVSFSLRRQVWQSEIPGRIWLEPAGWGRSLLQVFHMNWEGLPAALQLSERRILTSYWRGAAVRAFEVCQRAAQMRACMSQTTSSNGAPHNW